MLLFCPAAQFIKREQKYKRGLYSLVRKRLWGESPEWYSPLLKVFQYWLEVRPFRSLALWTNHNECDTTGNAASHYTGDVSHTFVFVNWEFDFYSCCCAASEWFMVQMSFLRCMPSFSGAELSAITWAGSHVNTVWEHDSIRLAAVCAELLMPASSWNWKKVQPLKNFKQKQWHRRLLQVISLYHNVLSAAFV